MSLTKKFSGNEKQKAAREIFSAAFLSIFILPSCGSLASSQVDREMKANGRYNCGEKRIAHTQTPASGDFQVRCYRDSVSISGKRVDWARAFFSDASCSGNAIGFGEWEAKLLDTRPAESGNGYSMTYSEVTHRRLERKDAEWYLDAVSGCDLRRINVGTFTTVDYENPCSRLFPPAEKLEKRVLSFSSPSQGSSESLSGNWDMQRTTCGR